MIQIIELFCGVALAAFGGAVGFFEQYRLMNVSKHRHHAGKYDRAVGIAGFFGGLGICGVTFVDLYISFGVLAICYISMLIYCVCRKRTREIYLSGKRAKVDRIDKQMKALFIKRMKISKQIGSYKKEKGLSVRDEVREAEVLQKNVRKMTHDLRPYYEAFLRNQMDLSRSYQEAGMLSTKGDGTIRVSVGYASYCIYLQRGILSNAQKYIPLSEKQVLIVTDDGVPTEYLDRLTKRCKKPFVVSLPAGEASKNEENLHLLWSKMEAEKFTRSDVVVALGGGMVCDIAAFAAATYMRGIPFYSIPTTLLSQVDASIGGKCAINFAGGKNQIGVFRQPKAVLVDPDLLATLPKRQMSNGFAEVVKMALIEDLEMFQMFEMHKEMQFLDEIIRRCLELKKKIVERDETENGPRKLLNFGHTLGHGIEAVDHNLFHGECVGLGMIPMCAGEIRPRLVRVLEFLGLPTQWAGDWNAVFERVEHDKKISGDKLAYVYVSTIGHGKIMLGNVDDWKKIVMNTMVK